MSKKINHKNECERKIKEAKELVEETLKELNHFRGTKIYDIGRHLDSALHNLTSANNWIEQQVEEID